MRSRERLLKTRAWIERELCDGREMKAPDRNMDITRIVRQTPGCYIGWAPVRPDPSGLMQETVVSVCPGILIMPTFGHAMYREEKRFDRYDKIHRPEKLSQAFAIQMLFSLYEPGIRLPGFIESKGADDGLDMSLLKEGTEEGILTLYDWMDDCVKLMLLERTVPGTDLFLDEESVTTSLYADQSFIVDKRPIHYGFVSATYYGYVDEGVNQKIEDLLS